MCFCCYISDYIDFKTRSPHATKHQLHSHNYKITGFQCFLVLYQIVLTSKLDLRERARKHQLQSHIKSQICSVFCVIYISDYIDLKTRSPPVRKHQLHSHIRSQIFSGFFGYIIIISDYIDLKTRSPQERQHQLHSHIKSQIFSVLLLFYIRLY